ncbi:hypothetical protein SAMN05216532_8195 [Streptomyces sp. 2231.1]|uniref:hypothetical protein n=1 Tax=Streptomyces sp. 2231.1 TaxID=1855347 RepID=UPI00089D14EE|nr:hypothetical protein [Streptomyces sp. 2231.1]SEE65774.1 hypothetical protein SAMN05216532_8195 [Streptomyces sp. 2231.1]
MDQQSASVRFWSELSSLRELAGRPPLKILSKLAQGQHGAVETADSTISDWLTGKAVPRLDYRDYFLALVRYLHTASGRQWTQAVDDHWGALFDEARAEQDSLRGIRKDLKPSPAPPPRVDPPELSDRVRRQLFFTIGSHAGVKFNLIPPMGTYPSDDLSEFLTALERVGVDRQLTDPINARAADVAAAPAGEQFVAAVFKFAEVVDAATDTLREHANRDDHDWFRLPDLIGRIFVVVRTCWPEDPSEHVDGMRESLYALGERLDAPPRLQKAIQDFASMKLPTATLEEFANAALRLQQLCYLLL